MMPASQVSVHIGRDPDACAAAGAAMVSPAGSPAAAHLEVDDGRAVGPRATAVDGGRIHSCDAYGGRLRLKFSAHVAHDGPAQPRAYKIDVMLGGRCATCQ